MADVRRGLRNATNWVDGTPEARARRFFGGMDPADVPPEVLQLLRDGSFDDAMRLFTERMRSISPTVIDASEARPKVRVASSRPLDEAQSAKTPSGKAGRSWGQFAGDSAHSIRNLLVPQFPGGSPVDAAAALRRERGLPRQADIRELLGVGVLGGGAAGAAANAIFSSMSEPRQEEEAVDTSQMTGREYYMYLKSKERGNGR